MLTFIGWIVSITSLLKPRIHTGRLVGQIAAQIGPYNLLWCRRYKKIRPLAAIIGATGEQITGEQII